MIRFTVHGEPVSWERARAGKQRGVFFTSKKQEAARERIREAAIAAGATPLAGPLRLVVAAYFGRKARADCDNVAKLVGDSLNEIAFVDDAQIVALVVSKQLDRDFPRTVVEVEQLAPGLGDVLPEVGTVEGNQARRADRKREKKAEKALAKKAASVTLLPGERIDFRKPKPAT